MLTIIVFTSLTIALDKNKHSSRQKYIVYGFFIIDLLASNEKKNI